MPTITNPPVIIDATNFSRPSFLEHQSYIFPVGDNVYAVLANSQTGHNRVGIYLSTDQGLNWTEQDIANAPTGSGRNFSSFFESGTGIISVCDLPGGAFRITQFDTNTNTWGTVGTAASVGSSNHFFYRQSGGTYAVIYTASSSVIRYVTNIAGTWSGSTILASSSGFVQGGVSDSSDNAYIFHSLTTGSPVHIFTINVSFAITGPITLTNTWDGLTRPSLKIYNTTSLAVAFIPGNGTDSVVVEIGTPLSALVFTRYGVFTKPDVNETEGWATLLVGTGGDLNIWWARLNLTTTPLVCELDQSVFSGSAWGAPIQYYDEVTNPPFDVVPDPMDEFVHTTDGFQLASGDWFLVIALETEDAGQPHCTGFFLEPSSAPPTPQTLTLIKVVQGGSAAPSDFTLTAVGGSPETEISGPGPQVGPDDVNAGTFELSETAPGGATWDAATSTWDGVTTWDGAGQYTPVWDCAGAPMPTPTSVVVSPGGGGPIPLGVTQVPDVDPTFQPLLSNGPYEFLIGGFFYQVLWNSGNRLGMFRRQASVGGMFTEVDQTNAPTGISGYGRATSRNTIISVCYMLPGNTTAQQVDFDVVAGTWGTPSLPVTLPAVTNLFCWVRRSDNTDVFVGAWASQWYYINNIAGVWGAVTNIHAHLGTVIGGVIDANDTIWFMINYDFGSNLSSVGLYPLSSSYALGGAIANRQLIFQGPPFPYRFYPDVALYGTNAIAFAYSTAVAPTDNCQLKVDIIRPLSAPVLTSFLVIISPAGSQSYLLKLHDDGTGVLNLFYVHETTAPTNQVLQTIWTDPFNWSAPTVFYDPAVTPPFAGAAAQQISSLSPLPSNGWAVGAGMQTDQPTEITTAEIIQESSGGGSSDVVCTVTNFFTGPPPNPPGPGQMNPVGCFELLRVDVTLTPARHLPVRGSVR